MSQLTCPAMVPAGVSVCRVQKEEESAATADVSLQTVCAENTSTNSCAGEPGV